MECCEDGRYKITRPPVWLGTGKYPTKSGRFIAVGNTDSLTSAQKADLYNNKASNLLFVSGTQQADELSSAPYNIPKNQMIVGINPSTNLSLLFQDGIKRFDVDEPWHHQQHGDPGWGPGFVDQVDAQLPADGKLYVSEYYHWQAGDVITPLINDYAPLVSTKTKFGTHSQWEYFEGMGTLTDPRSQWTQLKNALAGQGKFEHGWVRTIKTIIYLFGSRAEPAAIEEMQLIWGHANNVGANTMFIMVEGTDHQYYPYILDNALYAGFQAGSWVEREEEKVQAVFCCTTPTYEPDSCELLEIIHLGEFRWV